MASVNKVILLGNLGKDPQLDYLQSGTATCKFPMATSRAYKDRDGQQQEETEWHNIVLWGRTAEVAAEYLSKGRPVYIEGRITTRQYEDKQGQTRYFTEIVGERMQLLGDGGGRDTGNSPDIPDSSPPRRNDAPPATDDGDDMPF